MQNYINVLDEIADIKKEGLYRERKVIDSPQGATIKINDRKFINFSNNDYLGLANHDSLKAFMIKAVQCYGIGSASSQLITGYTKAHQDLEHKLIDFLSRDAALIFPTGYQANLAIASAFIDKETLIFQDKLNHASLIDAALISKGKLIRYKHNDVEHLDYLMNKNIGKKSIVMTDGVFSMDGDFAKLQDLVNLCKCHDALLIVDDAHGVGVLGMHGAGLTEKLSLDQNQVPLLIGTFGKAFGMSGAFISGDKTLIDALVQKARPFIYSTSLSPSIAATINHAVDIVSSSNNLREDLKNLISYFRQSMVSTGIDQSISDSHIQPIIIGDAVRALKISEELYNENIIATAIRPPTVPSGTSRLRISLTALHKREHIDHLMNVLGKLIH